jgi:G3E family GTPase
MKLLIIAGFLGSGKTTFLLKLARAFSARATGKLAIIENEVGQTGVDDQHLQAEGLPVREIYSGCICCSLRLDLIHTLLELEREHAPDLVILEPSGVASPRQVLNALQGYGGEIHGIEVVVLVDAPRFQAIQDLSIPLITDGIHAADTILLNKIDLVSQGEISDLTTRIRQIRPDAKIQPVSAVSDDSISELVDALVRQPTAAPKPPDPDMPAAEPPADAPRPTVHTHETNLTFARPIPAEQLQDQLGQMVGELAANIKDGGAKLIGHIKGIIRGHGNGFYLVSLTDFNQPPQAKGRLGKEISQATITLNTIVYEIEKDTLHTLVTNAIKQHLAP